MSIKLIDRSIVNSSESILAFDGSPKVVQKSFILIQIRVIVRPFRHRKLIQGRVFVMRRVRPTSKRFRFEFVFYHIISQKKRYNFANFTSKSMNAMILVIEATFTSNMLFVFSNNQFISWIAFKKTSESSCLIFIYDGQLH